MPSIADTIKANAAYVFVAVGVVWAVLAYVASAGVVLWPSATCLLSGVLMKLRPGERLTWAFSISSAALGLLVSGYQVYFWSPLVGGSASSMAGISMGLFGVFAAVHLYLIYAGSAKPSNPI